MNLGYHHKMASFSKGLGTSEIFTGLAIILGISFLTFFAFQQHLLFALVAFIVIVPLLIILMIKRPGLALLINLILYFSPISSRTGDYFFFAWVFITVLFYGFVKKRFYFDSIIILWCCNAFLVLLTVPKWNNLLAGVRGMQYAFVMPLFIYWLITQDIIGREERNKIFTLHLPLLALYISGQVIVLILLGNAFSGNNAMSAHTGFDLIWTKSNGTAAAAVLFASILYGIQSVNMKWKIPAIIMSTLLVLLAFIIVSRGAVLSLVVGYILFYFLRALKERSVDVKKYIAPITSGVILVAIIGGSYVGTLLYRFKHMRIEMSFFARLYMYYDCFKYMVRSPLVGAGPNQYEFKDYFTSMLDPHNMFLRYGVEVGVLSIAIVSVILVIPIVRCLRKYDKNIYALTMFPYFVGIMNSQFESAITRYNYGMVFWILYAFMMKLIDEKKLTI